MNGRIDLSVAQRLGAGFLLLLGVLSAVLAAGHYWSERSAAAERAFTERIAPLSHATEDLGRALLGTAVAIRAFMLTQDEERRARYRASADATRSALRGLSELPREKDGEALFRPLAAGIERYLAVAGGEIGASPATERQLAEAREQATAALQSFTDLQRTKAQRALAAIRETRESAAQALALAALAGALLFAVLAALTIRSIQRPTRELVGTAVALQRGDWKPALAWAPAAKNGAASAPRDEMRRLAHAFGAAAAALEAREQRLRADRSIAAAAAASLSVEEVAADALRAVADHLGAEVGALYWAEEEPGLLRPVALRAIQDAAAPAITRGEGIPGRAARELRPVVVRDIPRDSPFVVRLGYDQAPPRAVAAVPIIFHGTLLGVLTVGSLRDLDEAAVSFLQDAAGQLAVGLQNVKTYQKVQLLLHELSEKNHQIQGQNEELQAQNEELQAQSEEIQAQNEELQAQGEEISVQNDQLKQQADALRTHAGSLAEADRRKSEFLGVLAHELRNPMAAISNSLYTLTSATQESGRRSRAEEIIRRQTRLLGRLVDDLLDVTRISSGKVRLQMERVDLAAVVRECAEDYRDVARAANVRLTVAVPDTLVDMEGDRTRLCQIVGNLLDNAIKFANGGREAEVRLAVENGRARLSVKDRGIGMDTAMIARLFQPFSQADSSLARRRSGLGLGLALSKALVDLHHGSIEARSDGPGKGSELIVNFPISGSAAVRPPAQRAAPSVLGGRGRRILIIEDNPDAAASLRDAMEIAGHEVRVALDASEGIGIAREFHPEILLCDIGLPTMDGYQVARTFRSDDELSSTYLIAVTGYASDDDRIRAFDAGFDHHVGKPPDIEKLHRLLAQVRQKAAG